MPKTQINRLYVVTKSRAAVKPGVVVRATPVQLLYLY